MLFLLAHAALLWQMYYFYQAFKNIVDNSQTPIQACTDSCLLCRQYVPWCIVRSGDFKANKAHIESILVIPWLVPELFKKLNLAKLAPLDNRRATFPSRHGMGSYLG